jgi:hypothetical protein
VTKLRGHSVFEVLATMQSRILFIYPLFIKNSVKIYKSIILSVVLCGCESWYVIQKEEDKVRESEQTGC